MAAAVPLALSLALAVVSLVGLQPVYGEVYVMDPMQELVVTQYSSAPASFGQKLPSDGFRGHTVETSPADACTIPDPPPNVTSAAAGDSGSSDVNATAWIAVIKRSGNCGVKDKVQNAMKAGFAATIIHGESDSLEQDVNETTAVLADDDDEDDDDDDDDDLVPTVFIGQRSAKDLLSFYSWPNNFQYWIVLEDDPFDINTYLLPFAIVVGICFVIMIAIVIWKFYTDFRRSRRHRLPRSALKKLPIHKFKAGDPFETCCICLDDFEVGEKLRILPCDHGYHAKCIDPWLVKTKRICPQCRKRVFESNSRGARLISATASERTYTTTTAASTDTDDDSDGTGMSGVPGAETRPLLRAQAEQNPTFFGRFSTRRSSWWTRTTTSTSTITPTTGTTSSSRSSRAGSSGNSNSNSRQQQSLMAVAAAASAVSTAVVEQQGQVSRSPGHRRHRRRGRRSRAAAAGAASSVRNNSSGSSGDSLLEEDVETLVVRATGPPAQQLVLSAEVHVHEPQQQRGAPKNDDDQLLDVATTCQGQPFGGNDDDQLLDVTTCQGSAVANEDDSGQYRTPLSELEVVVVSPGGDVASGSPVGASSPPSAIGGGHDVSA